MVALFLLAIAWCVSASARPASADARDLRISVVSVAPPVVQVEGAVPAGARALSFRDSYAGRTGIAARIRELKLEGESGPVPVRAAGGGEYRWDAGSPTRFSYTVALEPPTPAADAAYISWLAESRGVLMIGDLVPLEITASPAMVTLHLAVPSGWRIASSDAQQPDGAFDLTDPQHTVFLVARDLRVTHNMIRTLDLAVAMTGEWAFSDEDATRLAASIIDDQSAMIGGAPGKSAMLIISPFPAPALPERWSAETRGTTTLLLSGAGPSRTAALARLSVPLTHELFHFWVPNSLSLDGDYAWFYEGFTIYESLRTGVRLELFTFQDFLDAIARAYDTCLAQAGQDRISLIDASARRWAGTSLLVYQKGLLVAFLYDLTLRMQSRGKRSLDDAYRELYARYHKAGARTDARAAILGVLGEPAGMRPFNEAYFEKPVTIDLAAVIEPFGLRAVRFGARTRIEIAAPLKRGQRDLLRPLGLRSPN